MADEQDESRWESALDRVRSSADTRPLLLLAVALCRRVWERFPYEDCRRAVEAVERLADHPDVAGADYGVAAEADAATERLQQGYARVHAAEPGPRGAYLAALCCGGMWHDPTGLIGNVADAAAIAAAGCAEGPAWEAERRAQIALFDQFVGPASRPADPDGVVPTRFFTISFDDGFRRSSEKTAALYERFGLRADFNVVATFEEKNPIAHGDWALWNELAARGHHIHPHGFDHTNKADVPLETAQSLIRRCLDRFAANLADFDPMRAVFSFPYNASTPELEAWLPSVVRAFRTGPGPAINPLPGPETVRLTTSGWQDAEPWLDRCVDDLLGRDSGWLIYCAHGLDGEGYGPLRSAYLERLLDRLARAENLAILPTRAVLERFTIC